MYILIIIYFLYAKFHEHPWSGLWEIALIKYWQTDGQTDSYAPQTLFRLYSIHKQNLIWYLVF